MFFHKFQKVSPIYFEMPLGFNQAEKKLPPKNNVNVLRWSVRPYS